MDQTQRQQTVPMIAPVGAWFVIVGVMVYVALDVIAQVLTQYSPIAQAESDLAVGSFGMIMAVNFVVRGIVSFAVLTVLARYAPSQTRSPVGMALFGVWALGSCILAFFPTDLAGAPPTLHGIIHLGVASLSFVCAPIGAWLIARKLAADARWGKVAPIAQGIAIAAFAVFLVELSRFGARHYAGLIERVFLGLVLVWMVIIVIPLVASAHAPSQIDGGRTPAQ